MRKACEGLGGKIKDKGYRGWDVLVFRVVCGTDFRGYMRRAMSIPGQ